MQAFRRFNTSRLIRDSKNEGAKGRFHFPAAVRGVFISTSKSSASHAPQITGTRFFFSPYGARHFSTKASVEGTKVSADGTEESIDDMEQGDTPSSCSTAPPAVVPQKRLNQLAFAKGLPYVGFGFLDNFLMIIMGDKIDGTFCVTFGFSTMAAAALGNTISDVAGVFSGGVVEDMARKAGIDVPRLTAKQLDMRIVKIYSYTGQTWGIVIGCLLGMCPLMWIDPDEPLRLKKEKDRLLVFDSVLVEVKEMLKAEASVLMFVDKETGELTSACADGVPEFRSKQGGIMGNVIRTGQYANIEDVQETEWYDPERHHNYQGTGISVKSVLCMPVFDTILNEKTNKYEVIGVIEVINKEHGPFNTKDEDVLAAICSHVSIALSTEGSTFKKVLESCNRQMKQRACIHLETTAEHRTATLHKTILDEVTTLVRTERASLLLNAEGVNNEHELTLAAASSGHEGDMECEVLRAMCARAAKTGRMVKYDDVIKAQDLQESERKELLSKDINGLIIVPIFDSDRKVIGLLQCINKTNNTAFNAADVELLVLIGSHIALTLEGEGSSIKKLLRIVKHQQSTRLGSETEASDDAEKPNAIENLENMNVVCFANRAINLPSHHKVLNTKVDNPCLVMEVVKGDPLDPLDTSTDLNTILNKSSFRTKRTQGDSDPTWNDHIYLDLPPGIDQKNIGEYYVYVQIWNSNKDNGKDKVSPNGSPVGLMGHMVYPLSRILQADSMNEPRCFPIIPIQGQKGNYDMNNARLYMSFGLEEKDEQNRRMQAGAVETNFRDLIARRLNSLQTANLRRNGKDRDREPPEN